MLTAWGHRAAAIDIDDLYRSIDARWELPYDNERNTMVVGQAAQLALSLIIHGWRTVLICGNSLFDPADTTPMLTALSPTAHVHHITLSPDLATVLRRCAADPGRDPARLTADAHLLASRPHPGTAVLDNTDMTPQQILAALARLVANGAGRLTCAP
jgi:hypothetical protein